MNDRVPQGADDRDANIAHVVDSRLPAIFEACGATTREELYAALEQLSDDEVQRVSRCWELMANPYQLPPPRFASGEFRNWMFSAARGVGKNYASMNWLCANAEQENEVPHLFGSWMLFAGISIEEASKAIVEPGHGLIDISKQRGYPIEWDSRNHIAHWPNGVQLHVYGSFEPGTLRGKSFGKAVLDEWMFWTRNPANLVMVIIASIRGGKNPQVMWTCNPNNQPWCRRLVFELPSTIRTHAKLRDNVYLPESYVRQMELALGSGPRYRSEVLGEFSDENESALSNWGDINRNRIQHVPHLLDRVVIAVDPASGSEAGAEKGDEHGIVVVGVHTYPELHELEGQIVAVVLEDVSGHFGVVDGEWARKVRSVYDRWLARPGVQRVDVAVELNSGWGHVERGLRAEWPGVRLIKIASSQGKMLRAEPVGALIASGQVKFAGRFPELEEELSSWIPNPKNSPNRLDALVHGVTELMLTERAAKKRATSSLAEYI